MFHNKTTNQDPFLSPALRPPFFIQIWRQQWSQPSYLVAAGYLHIWCQRWDNFTMAFHWNSWQDTSPVKVAPRLLWQQTITVQSPSDPCLPTPCLLWYIVLTSHTCATLLTKSLKTSFRPTPPHTPIWLICFAISPRQHSHEIAIAPATTDTSLLLLKVSVLVSTRLTIAFSISTYTLQTNYLLPTSYYVT